MSRKARHPILGLVLNGCLMAAAFGLLGKTIWDHRDEIREVLNRKLDARFLAVAFAIYLAGIVLTFVRWFFLVRVVDPSFRLGAAFLLGFIGNLFNLIIPGGVGGDLIKAAYLVRMRVRRTQAVASMVIDRIVGLLGLFLLAGAAGALAWPSVGSESVRRLIVVVWMAIGLGFLGLALIFSGWLPRAFPRLMAGHGKLAAILRELDVMSSTYRRRLGVVAACLVLSSSVHSLFVLAFYLIGKTLFPDVPSSLGQHFLMVPLTLFTMAAPLPFGALGVSEQASEELFLLVGHPGGALAMMGFRVLMYAGGLVCATVYLANLRQVRGLTEAAGHLADDLSEDLTEETALAQGVTHDSPD
jgi:uncharacterized protein (TIRG00374 family)